MGKILWIVCNIAISSQKAATTVYQSDIFNYAFDFFWQDIQDYDKPNDDIKEEKGILDHYPAFIDRLKDEHSLRKEVGYLMIHTFLSLPQKIQIDFISKWIESVKTHQEHGTDYNFFDSLIRTITLDLIFRLP